LGFQRWLKSFFKKKKKKSKRTKKVSKKSDTTLEVGPAWFEKAKKELGVEEIPGFKHNHRILEYGKAVSYDISTDEIPWCASFVSWCLGGGTKSARARSYEKYGTKLTNPRLGCIVVFWRKSKSSGKGHVGFYVGEEDGYILVLGGNQKNSVCVSRYSKKRLLGYRWPS